MGSGCGGTQTLVLGAGGCCCLHVKLRDGNVSLRRVRGAMGGRAGSAWPGLEQGCAAQMEE